MKSEREITVAELMSNVMYTVTSDTSVASAQRLAKTAKVKHLLVLDNGVLRGIISHKDLATARYTHKIVDYMTSPVMCVAPSMPAQDAITLMAEMGVGCLPVISCGYLVGIITKELVGEKKLEDISFFVSYAAN